MYIFDLTSNVIKNSRNLSNCYGKTKKLAKAFPSAPLDKTDLLDPCTLTFNFNIRYRFMTNVRGMCERTIT